MLDIVDLFRLKDPRQVEVRGRALRDGESKILDVVVKRHVPFYPVAPAITAEEMSDDINNMFGEGGSGSGVLGVDEGVVDSSNVDVNHDGQVV